MAAEQVDLYTPSISSSLLKGTVEKILQCLEPGSNKVPQSHQEVILSTKTPQSRSDPSNSLSM